MKSKAKLLSKDQISMKTVEDPDRLIQERAYQLYLARDRRPGLELQDWWQAESEINGQQRFRQPGNA